MCDNTQATSYYIHYMHDTHAVSDYVLLLHNTKFFTPLTLTVQYQLNKNYSLSHCLSVKYQLNKLSVKDQLNKIIVYLIVIICSHIFLCHILT